jgi:hypothetical protein
MRPQTKSFRRHVMNRMKEDRKAYLDSIGILESDVKVNYGKTRFLRFYEGRQYFIFEGRRIWMPIYFQNFNKYLKRFKKNYGMI